MTLVVHLPAPLRPFAGGQTSLHIDGAATVREALSALPVGVRDRVLDERGELRRHVNVFVGERSVRDAEGLDTSLAEERDLYIIPAVSGG